MMDISDGLATDLRHILKSSGVGAELDSPLIPCHGTLEQALYNGEDFELLFTVRSTDVAQFNMKCTERFGEEFIQIGRISDQADELLLDGTALTGKAFEHFLSVSAS